MATPVNDTDLHRLDYEFHRGRCPTMNHQCLLQHMVPIGIRDVPHHIFLKFRNDGASAHFPVRFNGLLDYPAPERVQGQAPHVGLETGEQLDEHWLGEVGHDHLEAIVPVGIHRHSRQLCRELSHHRGTQRQVGCGKSVLYEPAPRSVTGKMNHMPQDIGELASCPTAQLAEARARSSLSAAARVGAWRARNHNRGRPMHRRSRPLPCVHCGPQLHWRRRWLCTLESTATWFLTETAACILVSMKTPPRGWPQISCTRGTWRNGVPLDRSLRALTSLPMHRRRRRGLAHAPSFGSRTPNTWWQSQLPRRNRNATGPHQYVYGPMVIIVSPSGPRSTRVLWVRVPTHGRQGKVHGGRLGANRPW
mmetsp:Transcript_2426/g.5420  ORF Transcript_2426/g.5420 Transcript_2426/m.5420 type:complete len:363 (+) Transcript_2426:753-1841(+)